MTEPLTHDELQRLLSIDEVADYIGIPKSSVYRWRVSGGGPRAMKVGKHLRFRRSDLEAWLNDQYEDDPGGGEVEPAAPAAPVLSPKEASAAPEAVTPTLTPTSSRPSTSTGVRKGFPPA